MSLCVISELTCQVSRWKVCGAINITRLSSFPYGGLSNIASFPQSGVFSVPQIWSSRFDFLRSQLTWVYLEQTCRQHPFYFWNKLSVCASRPVQERRCCQGSPVMQSHSAFVFALKIESSAASKMESLQARHSLKCHCLKRHKLQSGMNTSLKQWFPQKLAGEWGPFHLSQVWGLSFLGRTSSTVI